MSVKQVYIVGHKNPDTDSLVSAAAYTRLKHLLGHSEHYAVRAGKVLPQAEYIFERFKAPVPQYIPDMIPKAGYYMNTDIQPVQGGMSLWNAVAEMEAKHSKVIPVVNEKGAYSALLNYNAFAQNILRAIDPETATAMQTNIRLISETLSAQILFSFDTETLFKCVPIAASDSIDTFKKTLSLHTPENAVVVTGDREEVQEYAIDAGVRALILSSGTQLFKELRAKAEKKKVSVLISPYRTAETAMLVMYSAPASTMADTELKPVHVWDTIRYVRPLLARSASRTLPVVDDAGKLAGLLAENDLLHDPNIELILVDHNEASQALDGIEHYNILEVIDHHRLGTLSTKAPITFINRPVGATSTIIASLYKQNRVPFPKEIASILLCGILADTLGLHSVTTTPEDRDTAEFLSNITGLEIAPLTAAILNAASSISKRTAAELVHQDMKNYTEAGAAFTVSQVEVDITDELLERKAEVLAELEKERSSRDALFSALMVTDVTRLKSTLLIAAQPHFLSTLEFPRRDEGVYFLGDIVSRKKQLLPLLAEQINRLS